MHQFANCVRFATSSQVASGKNQYNSFQQQFELKKIRKQAIVNLCTLTLIITIIQTFIRRSMLSLKDESEALAVT